MESIQQSMNLGDLKSVRRDKNMKLPSSHVFSFQQNAQPHLEETMHCGKQPPQEFKNKNLWKLKVNEKEKPTRFSTSNNCTKMTFPAWRR